MTFFYKRIFPVVMGVGMVGGLSVMFLAPPHGGPPAWMQVVMPVFMLGVMGTVFWKLLWSLADEVTDLGDRLRVRRHGNEVDVPLSDILNVDRSMLVNPPRVILTRRSNRERIAFIPTGVRIMSLGSLRELDALIDRIDAARMQARR